MIVKQQKNVYYVDLEKRNCCGYVETTLVRGHDEQTIEFCCNGHTVDEVQVLDDGSILPVKTGGRGAIVTLPCGVGVPDEPTVTDGGSEPRMPEQELRLRVRYSFLPAFDGFCWYDPVSADDRHRELAGRGSDVCTGRAIAPYIDAVSLHQLVYIVPNKEDIRVASSGDQNAVQEEERNIVYTYTAHAHPTTLSFIVGTFDQLDIFPDSGTRRLLAPVGAGDLTDIQNDLQCIIRFIKTFSKAEQLGTISVVFAMADLEAVWSATDLLVLGVGLLPAPTSIEPAYHLKELLCTHLAWQLYAFLNWAATDRWIPSGLAGYLADHALRALLGNNEFHYRQKEDRNYLAENDILEPPLYWAGRRDSDYAGRFFATKSKLFFHCLEAHLSYAFLQKISDDALAAMAQGISQRGQFTHQFIKIVKDATGKDLSGLFDLYVFSPGILTVKLAFQINKRKNMVKVTPTVMPTSILSGAVKQFHGTVLLKSFETEGVFDHDTPLEGESVFFYHTRTKKKKKEEEEEEETMPLLFVRADPKKETLFRFIVDQPDYMHMEQLAEKNVFGQMEAIEALSVKPTAISCEALERALDNGHVFHRIRTRIFYALRPVNIDGYSGLQRLIQYFVRNRCVPNSTVLRGNEFGLVNYFIQKHLVTAISQLVPGISREDSRIVIAFLENILRFNDSSSSYFDDSFYIGSIIDMLSAHTTFYLSGTKSPNSENHNSVYLSGIKSPNLENYSGNSIKIFTECDKENIGIAGKGDEVVVLAKCLESIERYRIMDVVFPSHTNVISRYCLVALIRLDYCGLISVNKELLDLLSHRPTLPQLRLMAIEGLLVTGKATVDAILGFVAGDTSHFIAQALAIVLRLFSLGLVSINTKDIESTTEQATTEQMDGMELLINLAKTSSTASLLVELCKLHSNNSLISKLATDIGYFLAGKQVGKNEYAEAAVKAFKPEGPTGLSRTMKNNRISRRIKVTALDELRLAILLSQGIVRVPALRKRPVISLRRTAPTARIPYRRFIPKNEDAMVFWLSLPGRVYKNEDGRADFALLVISKLREHSAANELDEFLKRARPGDFFDWAPLTFRRIQEKALRNGPVDILGHLKPDGPAKGHFSVIAGIHRSLVYVLSYSVYRSRMYLSARTLAALLEKLVYAHCPIPSAVIAMGDQTRGACRALLDELMAEPAYNCFVEPVDYSGLKTYIDIVRIPVCLKQVSGILPVCNSYDVFIAHLDRIVTNCLWFNHSQSGIAKLAQRLKARVNEFKGAMLAKGTHRLEHKESYSILEDILKGAGDTGCFTDLIKGIRDIKTWGELDNALDGISQRHGKEAQCGFACGKDVEEIKRKIERWFPIRDKCILNIQD